MKILDIVKNQTVIENEFTLNHTDQQQMDELMDLKASNIQISLLFYTFEGDQGEKKNLVCFGNTIYYCSTL